MGKQNIILISKRDRELILKYGYPFENIETQLTQADGKDLIRISDVAYWWEQVIVNLHISEVEGGTQEYVKELRTLIDRIAIEINLV